MRRSVGPISAALAMSWVLLAAGGCLRADVRDPFRDLPPGWRVKSSSVVPKEQAAQIGEKLGGKIAEVRQTVLRVEGKTLQVNIVGCPTTRDAWAIYRALLKMKGNPAFSLYFGDTVVEFVCDDYGLVKRAHYALGFRPFEAAYKVSFDLAAVDEADYMKGNDLYNLFLQLEWRTAEEATRSDIGSLSKGFRFGKSLRLRTGRGSANEKPTYTLTPKPSESKLMSDGDVTEYRFADLPKREGVPYVSVKGVVSCRAFADTPTSRIAGPELLAATPYWPVNDAKITKLAKEITGGKNTQEEKVAAILRWLVPGKNMSYSGPMGSRHGVLKALEQRFGRCWDFSDIFVTLCRASRVPCRQVAGWMYGQSGHVWSEVLLAGKGWRQVDPTTGVACDTDYVPWLTTEDGEMPIVYVSMPRVELAEPASK
jgi:hypothetical protein